MDFLVLVKYWKWLAMGGLALAFVIQGQCYSASKAKNEELKAEVTRLEKDYQILHDANDQMIAGINSVADTAKTVLENVARLNDEAVKIRKDGKKQKEELSSSLHDLHDTISSTVPPEDQCEAYIPQAWKLLQEKLKEGS